MTKTPHFQKKSHHIVKYWGARFSMGCETVVHVSWLLTTPITYFSLLLDTLYTLRYKDLLKNEYRIFSVVSSKCCNLALVTKEYSTAKNQNRSLARQVPCQSPRPCWWSVLLGLTSVISAYLVVVKIPTDYNFVHQLLVCADSFYRVVHYFCRECITVTCISYKISAGNNCI